MGDRAQALQYFGRCAEIESPYQRKARAEIARLERIAGPKGTEPPPNHFPKEALSSRSTAER
jgi:hypothetical protein